MNEGWAERRVARPSSTLLVGLVALALSASGCQEKKEVDPPLIPLPTAAAPVPPPEQPATVTPTPAATPDPPATPPAGTAAPAKPAPKGSGAAPQSTGPAFLNGLPVKLPQGLPKLPL